MRWKVYIPATTTNDVEKAKQGFPLTDPEVATVLAELKRPSNLTDPYTLVHMIENEILDIVADQTNEGDRLNEVADQFRRGRDVKHLIGLLDSSNAELVSIGAWILGELSFELYNSESIVSRLRRLTEHIDPAVRFHALGALYPALNPEEATTQALLRKLLRDPNDGVRRAAESAAARLSLT